MKKHIPYTLTCCNLLCGCLSIYFSAIDRFDLAFCLILLAAVFDFFDGFVARLLKVSSEIGKELDSLADCVTFGVAPSMSLLFFLLSTDVLPVYACFLPLVMAAFSAVRLAKFNLDTRQTDSFIGLATPSNAIFWSSLVASLEPSALPVLAYWCLAVFPLLSSYLLVSEIPFFSLKFHSFLWKENKIRFVFLIGTLLFIVAGIVVCFICDNHRALLSLGWVVILWYSIVNLFNLRK